MRFSGHLVDEGREGLLLLALSRAAEEQGARGRALGPGALLPPRRHAAVRGPARSTSARICRRGSSAAASTEDGRYLLIVMFEGLGQQQPAVLRRPRRPDGAQHRRRRSSRSSRPTMRSSRRFGNQGTVVYLRSDKDAPNRKVIAVDLAEPGAVGVEDDRARAARRRSRASPSSAAASSRSISSTCRAGCRCSASTARRRATSRCRASGTVGAARAAARMRRTSGTASARRSTPSTVYRYDPATKTSTPFEAAAAADRCQPLRNEGAVRHVEGRHARAVLPDREEGPAARRQQPDDALRLRRVLGQHAADLPRRTCRRGSSWAASG